MATTVQDPYKNLTGTPATAKTYTPTAAAQDLAAQIYNTTDYSSLLSKAQAAPATYKAYDYSTLQSKANAPVQSYDTYDYTKSMGLADTKRTSTAPTSVVDYNDVNSQINKAANTLSTPTLQDTSTIGNITSNIMSSLDPVARQNEAKINQQYDQSAQKLSELMSAKGLTRSGSNVAQLQGLETNRNTALADANANLINSALQQAINAGQLQLSEKGLLQGQQSTAADQLAALTGQQTSARQFSDTYNANQDQALFDRVNAVQQQMAAENQYGQQFNAAQDQNQFNNLQTVAQLAAAENQFGQQFNADQAQNQFGNLATAMQAQAGENQFGATYGQNAQQLAQALQIAQMNDATNRYGTDTNAATSRYATDTGASTSKYNTDTNAAVNREQLASDAAYQERQQQLAQLQALLNYNLGVGQTTTDLPIIEGFTYGDAMNKLLKQIYGI